MKGYKVFNPDWTCRGFQYEVGKTYTMKDDPIICQSGFHFCTKAEDCFNYYRFDSNNKVAEVEAKGKTVTQNGDSKITTNQLKIIRELSWHEVLELVNTGKNNTGFANSGNRNSGDWNSGYWNSGYCNSGNCNSGNRNSGGWNSGNRNSGYWNSGNCNSGNRNSGGCNSGDWNSGYCNSGNCNSGNRNSGGCNSGNRNSGYWNSGNCNSGDWNSGNWNSGDGNSGNWNSGNWNSCDFSAGVFCTETPNLLIFDKPTCMTLEGWRGSKAAYLLSRMILTEWVDDKLITHEYKDACRKMWDGFTDKEKEVIKAIPNFDADKFEQITGIKI